MDWDFKMPPWDLEELEQNAAPNLALVAASSGGLGRQTSQLDFSVDLKLGGLGDSGSSERWKEQPKVSTMASSSSLSKRARAPSNGSQNVLCSVDGCKSDLSNCREYHRRHKVCEVHSKTPIVMVGGLEQRFCQQCSRFHLLVEFDEVKRSCRKRLDGHNRRRRKPQPESSNSGCFFPSHQGTRFSSYPQLFSSVIPNPNWAGIVKTEEDAFYTHYPPLHFIDRQQYFPSSYKDGKQFHFLQESSTTLSGRTALEPAGCQPVPKTISPVECSSNRMFSEGLNQVLDSDCALSLLSSPTQTSGINLGQTMPADRTPMGLPLVSSLQYSELARYSHSQASNIAPTTGFSCPGAVDGCASVVSVSKASNANISCHDIFHVTGEGSSNGSSQALPFSWQ